MRIVLADDLEALKERVIACGIEVHRTLGPGLLESIYRGEWTSVVRFRSVQARYARFARATLGRHRKA